MKESEPEQPNAEYLASGARWIAGILGIALAAIAVGSHLLPIPTAFEWDAAGAISKSARNVSDIATFATACLVAGVALFAFALNGVRFVRFSFGSFGADGGTAEESAKRYYKHPGAKPEREVEGSGNDVPEESEEPVKVLKTDDAKVAVFKLADVPSQVIIDALAGWPNSAGRKPETLAEFEFAARKRGQGNNAWTVKFRDRDPVRVSYGGKGKREGTTSTA